jgi:uncharacterized protein (TIGR03382 family)
MFVKRVSPVAALLAGIAVFAIGSTAKADISDIVIRIEASNALGTAVFQGHLSDGTFYEGGEYIWELRSPTTLFSDSGQMIASITGARVRCVDDPVVQLNFSVSAGSIMTSFTITSPTLSFGTISQAEGRVSAGVTTTDVDGDGSNMSPSAQPGMYTSRYNGAVPGGTLFADLLPNSVMAGAFSSNTANGSFPGGGAFSAIANPVSDMSARYNFTLSANDDASGTSTYEIRPVPAPGALALMGLGGLLAGRRRRH